MITILKVFFRRRRILIGLSLGIFLAFSFATISLLSADYLGAASTMKYLDRSEIDYMIAVSGVTKEKLENVSGVLSNDPLIDDFAIVSSIELWPGLESNTEYGGYVTSVNYVYDYDEMEGLTVVKGNKTLTNGFAIPKFLSSIMDIDIGDELTLYQEYWNETIQNISRVSITRKVEMIFKVSGLLEQVLKSPGTVVIIDSLIPSSQTIQYYPILVSETAYREIRQFLFQKTKNLAFLETSYRIYVKTDRNKLVVPWDTDTSLKKVDTHFNKLLSSISLKMKTEYYENYLHYRIQYINFSTFFMRSSMIFFILPVMLLGVLLTGMTNWLTLTTRSRDIALLKARGVGNRAIFTAIGIEGFFASFVAGALGGLIGSSFFPIFIKFYFPREAASFNPYIISYKMLPYYTVGSGIIGGLLGLTLAFYTWRKGLKVELVDALVEHIEKLEEKLKLERHDYILLLVGIYGLFELISGSMVARIFTQIMMRQIILAIFFSFFFMFELLSVAIGPILFMYEASKLASVKIDKFKSFFGLIISPFLGELKDIAIKNFSRKPSRTSRVLLILSLTFSITLIYPIVTETLRNRELIDSRISLGGDIRVSGLGIPYSLVDDINHNLTIIEGVKNIAYVSTAKWGDLSYAYSVSIYCLTPSYFSLKYVKEEYLVGLDLEEAYQGIQENGTVILSTSIKRQLNVTVGDTLAITTMTPEGEKISTLKVIGFIKFIPGISRGVISSQIWDRIILVGNTTYESLFHFEPEIGDMIIEVEGGYNITLIKETVVENLEAIGFTGSAITLEEYMEERRLITLSWILPAMSQLEIYLTSLISILAIAIVMAVSIYERKKEIALHYARGFDKSRIRMMILGESILIVVLAALISLIPAMAYSMSFLLGFQFMIVGYPVEFPSGYLLTLPWYLIPLIFALLIIYIITPLIPLTTVLRREALVEEVRIRH